MPEHETSSEGCFVSRRSVARISHPIFFFVPCFVLGSSFRSSFLAGISGVLETYLYQTTTADPATFAAVAVAFVIAGTRVWDPRGVRQRSTR
jgi:hypothetical protein